MTMTETEQTQTQTQTQTEAETKTPTTTGTHRRKLKHTKINFHRFYSYLIFADFNINICFCSTILENQCRGDNYVNDYDDRYSNCCREGKSKSILLK